MYEDGSYFEAIFETPQGPVQVLAEVHVFGKHLVLDELLVFPEEQPRLAIGTRQTLAILRHLRIKAKEQGFTEITVTYHRIGERLNRARRDYQTVVRTRRLS